MENVKLAVVCAAWLTGGLCFSGSLAADPLPAREKYLLLDSRVVDHVENAQLSVGKITKHPANPLFKQDKPWERDLAHMYNNIIFDEEEQIYKLWYYTKISVLRGNQEDLSKHITPGPLVPNDITKWNEALLYATSKDGIKWEKPAQDIYKYKGKPCNMLIWGVPGTGVFKDLRDPDPSRRYKLITGGVPHGVVLVAFSPDGIHWSKRQEVVRGENQAELKADTHNNAFWAPDLKKYIGITRAFPRIPEVGQVRTVLRMESDDFIHWTKPVQVLYGPYNAQTYAMPVFPYAGVYLGLAVIYRVKPAGLMDTELTWSPDTKVWHRIDEGNPLIPLSPGRTHDSGCIFGAAYPLVMKDEIRIYYSGQSRRHGMNPGFFCLATLRIDGWAGYEQQDKGTPAVVVTQPLTCDGKTLCVTADVSSGGSVKVTVLDTAGKFVAEAKPITTTVTDGTAVDVVKQRGKAVSIRLEIDKAKVYSLRFIGKKAKTGNVVLSCPKAITTTEAP